MNLVLEVCLDGVIQTREFDPEDEAIEAIGEALLIKEQNPGSVVYILVSPPVFSGAPESESLVELFNSPAAA